MESGSKIGKDNLRERAGKRASHIEELEDLSANGKKTVHEADLQGAIERGTASDIETPGSSWIGASDLDLQNAAATLRVVAIDVKGLRIARC